MKKVDFRWKNEKIWRKNEAKKIKAKKSFKFKRSIKTPTPKTSKLHNFRKKPSQSTALQ